MQIQDDPSVAVHRKRIIKQIAALLSGVHPPLVFTQESAHPIACTFTSNKIGLN